MTTAIDTNVIVALWGTEPGISSAVQEALDAIGDQGPLVMAAPVFAELQAAPSRSASLLDSFCEEAGIRVEWELRETIWRAAGEAFRGYAIRRRKHREIAPRRILTDFLIGAHARENGYHLLTLDERLYRAAFPKLEIVRI
ncbi:MAG: type II toxin-antitoxin system VapC family toxin [Candidatus Acidiferrales bacterium]